MGTANSELLAQLKTAVSGWTAEVGAAQQRLSQQIDGANTQLDRLLAALQERNGHAAALAAADAEIERLKRSLQQGDLPPGTVTQYSAGPPPRIDSVRRELDATVGRLQTAITSWTAEVTHSQGDLLNQFNAANTQLQRLLQFLGAPSAGTVAAYSLELDQVRHERDILADEVRALNIEIETLRREQETFASANLDAEADLVRSQREEVVALQRALAERDAFIDECQALLGDSQRIEASLGEEIAALEQQVAVYARTEDQLKATIDQQRRDSEQHLQALVGLSGEMEALRHALARESDSAPEDDVRIPDDAPDALTAARDGIERLEARLGENSETIARLEYERAAAEMAADALREQIRELESRPDGAAVARLEAQVERLEGLLSEQRQRGTETIDDARALAHDLEITNRNMAAEPGMASGLTATAPEEQLGLEAAMAQIEGELASLRRREEDHIAAARALVQDLEAQRDVEAEREEKVALLESQLAEVSAEKEALRESTAQQEAEMRAAMAEVSEALTERDELREALENTGEEKGRVYAGEAGMGSGAAESAAAREQRMRQGDILLSELTHAGDGRSLGDILADAEIITREQLDAALTIQGRDPSQLIGTILIEQEFTTDDAIAQAVACQFNKAVVNPMELHVQPDAIALLNRDICTWHVCIPLRVTGDRLVVAMANPLDESAIYKLRDVSQREITPVVSAASQIMTAIEAHYGTF